MSRKETPSTNKDVLRDRAESASIIAFAAFVVEVAYLVHAGITWMRVVDARGRFRARREARRFRKERA